MTQWGMLLLGASVALGLSRTAWNKAGRVAIVVTVIVVAEPAFLRSMAPEA